MTIVGLEVVIADKTVPFFLYSLLEVCLKEDIESLRVLLTWGELGV